MYDDLDELTDWAVVQRLLLEKGLGQGPRMEIDEQAMRQALKKRVIGQDHVIDTLVKSIRIQFAKKVRTQPVANLLFLGPTGTGKTEIAKALAEYLYGDEKSLCHIECQNLKHTSDITSLLGVPPGYVDTGKMGRLTQRVKDKPRQVVLFDEIDKAHPDVADLFLSMMGEGRVTDTGTGMVVDFTQTIIVLTSNQEKDALLAIQERATDANTLMDDFRKHLMNQQVFRPEIIGRLDAIHVFKPLRDIVIGRIAAKMMRELAQTYELKLVRVDPALVAEAIVQGTKRREFGARELQRVVAEMLGELLVVAEKAGYKEIEVGVKDPAEGKVLTVREVR